jgi:hypothetical protein
MPCVGLWGRSLDQRMFSPWLRQGNVAWIRSRARSNRWATNRRDADIDGIPIGPAGLDGTRIGAMGGDRGTATPLAGPGAGARGRIHWRGFQRWPAGRSLVVARFHPSRMPSGRNRGNSGGRSWSRDSLATCEDRVGTGQRSGCSTGAARAPLAALGSCHARHRSPDRCPRPTESVFHPPACGHGGARVSHVEVRTMRPGAEEILQKQLDEKPRS